MCSGQVLSLLPPPFPPSLPLGGKISFKIGHTLRCIPKTINFFLPPYPHPCSPTLPPSHSLSPSLPPLSYLPVDETLHTNSTTSHQRSREQRMLGPHLQPICARIKRDAIYIDGKVTHYARQRDNYRRTYLELWVSGKETITDAHIKRDNNITDAHKETITDAHI